MNTPDEARRRFGANLVLTGTFQDTGSGIRLVYSLVDPAKPAELRGETLTLTAADPFAAQTEVVTAVLRMLELELSSPERALLLQFGTQNKTAYRLYSEARGSLQEFQKQENVDRAIELFREALQLDSTYAGAYAGLGQAYWLKFQQTAERMWIEAARESCLEAARHDYELASVHLCLGTIDHSTGEYERAAQEFTEALKHEPTADDAHRGLGLALEAQSKFGEAEAALKNTIAFRDHYWASYLWLAAFYERRGRFKDAIEQYEAALARSPNNGGILLMLGIPYIRLGEYRPAIDAFKKAVDILPSRESYNNLGQAYVLVRQYADAIPLLEKAAALTEHYRATGNLARAYWLERQFEKGREIYERAIRQAERQLLVNARDSDAHLSLGGYHAALSHKSEAISHLNIALNAHREDAHYLTLAAVAYTQLGDFETALTLLEKARSLGLTAVQVQAEPELEALRGSSRFQTIVGK